MGVLIDVVDPALVAWVDAALAAIEGHQQARCPLRAVPLDLVAAAVLRDAAPDEDLRHALLRIVGRYLATTLPPRTEFIEIVDPFHPGGVVTPERAMRDGS